MNGPVASPVTLDDLLGLPDGGPDGRAARPLVIEGGEALDRVAFERRIDAFAAQFAGLGIAPGGRVALWLPNGVDYLAAIFAVARRGALAVHINTRFGPAEVGDLLARTGATVIVTRGGFSAQDFLATYAMIPAARRASVDTIVAHDGDRDEAGGTPVIAPGADDGVPGDRLGVDDDPCLTFTTGGTTAQPKLVMHRQRSIAHHAGVVARHVGLDADDAVFLGAVPFCGTFGQVGALAAIAGGATLVCLDQFDAAAARDLIRRHQVTHTLGDDRMIARLAEVGGMGDYASVRFFAVAGFGGDAAAAIARGAAAGLAPRAIYGSSEAQALFAIGEDATGAVVPVDPAARATIAEGELLVAGPSLFAGYLDDMAASGAALDDGRFRTGDRATAAGDGFVFEGRLGDMLRLGGFLVNPMEIEAFLQADASVAEAQVVGVDTPRGNGAVAYVVAADGAFDEPALIARCRAALARYKVPQRIVALDAFPVSNGPNGPKISRVELRRMAAALDTTLIERK